jgi:multidrug efflux pump subunit AcrA (membrane-fusion protein)
MATLWVVDSAGTLREMRVKTGRSDGQKTEVEGRNLQEGMHVVTSVSDGSPAADAQRGATNNPFQPQRPGGRRGF